MANAESMHDFKIALLGIVFDPKTKRVLIGKRGKNSIPNATWCFPGGRLNLNEDVNTAIKRRISEKTNLKVENLGCVFTRVPQEQQNLLLAYFLCEFLGGEAKTGEKYKELKWVRPEEVERYFNAPFEAPLKEYIISLK